MSDQFGGADPAMHTPTRRRSRRKKVFKGARLVLGGGLSTVDCIVKDISASGARLKLPDITQIAGTLKLSFQDGETLEAEVIRSHGMEMGIRFKGGQRPALAPPPDPLEQVLFDLESPWLGEVLEQLATTEAFREPEVAEIAHQLHETYEALKAAVEARVGKY